MNIKIITLNADFYNRHLNDIEILKKPERPYIIFKVTINGVNWAIPFRGYINHRYSYKTSDNKGLDYTKAVPIDKAVDINNENVIIDNIEYKSLIGKERIVKNGFLKYLKKYKKAIDNPNVPANQKIIKYSSLQYFHVQVEKCCF